MSITACLFFLLILFGFSLFYIINNKETFKSFLRQRLEQRIAYYKIKSIYNDTQQAPDLVYFLEEEKRHFINKQSGIINNFVFFVLRITAGLSDYEYCNFIEKIYNDKINHIIKNDLIFKEFQRLSKANQWDLSDWDFILQEPSILFYAKEHNLIFDNNIDDLIEKVHYSKTDYGDKLVNDNLINIQEHVIQLLDQIKHKSSKT